MLNIRTATREDIPTIKRFILELAEYEKLLDWVSADEAKIENAIFIEKSAQAAIVECDGAAIGHVIYFYNFSTFLCLKGLYVEDIYIVPGMRGRGFGRAVFKYLAKIAQEENCGRMEWACLSWNKPSIAFYEGMGATMMDDWRVFRLDTPALTKLAE
ncbi:MAG: GNAT family N-acetyltransferase [Eubacteriales bacterium]